MAFEKDFAKKMEYYVSLSDLGYHPLYKKRTKQHGFKNHRNYIQTAPKGTLPVLHLKPADDELFTMLWDMGLDTHREMEYQVCPHVNIDNESVVCGRWVGYERTDAKW